VSRILVIGSEGFIGKTLTKSLEATEHEIFTLDLLPSIRPNHFQVDIVDRKKVSEVLSEIQAEIVIHLAAQIDVRDSFADPLKDLEINGKGIINVLLSSFENGCKNFCYLHSGGAIYDSNQPLPIDEDGKELPQSPYGLTKNLGEGYVRIFAEKYLSSWSSLALSNCYGPINEHGRGVIYELVSSIKNGVSPTLFGAETSRDFVYVEDVVDAIKLAINKPINSRVNISSASETTLLELFAKITEILGSKTDPIIEVPKFGEITRSSLSNRKAQTLLGWFPKYDLDTGLTKAIKGSR
jgi:UDP-glucose 4-epimerase